MPRKTNASEIKYLGLGLLIGMLIATVTIGAGTFIYFATPALSLAPAAGNLVVFDTPIPTSSASQPAANALLPTPTPTFTPTKIPVMPSTQPAQMTSTPALNVIEFMLESGQIQFTGPLSAEQQINLYNASVQYIAATTRGSLYLSKEINGVKYGNASNTCGPLAIAILRDAGILSQEVVPHDFWLLNPAVPNDRRLLNRTFPVERFLHAETKYPITKIDWKAFPLLPGDFIYIKSGTGGNFDHMLTVNRVDARGRAYAVTNYATEFGFVITEVMLYDPNDSKAGIFHTWTQKPNQMLGSTGFGGFEVWRLRPANTSSGSIDVAHK